MRYFTTCSIAVLLTCAAPAVTAQVTKTLTGEMTTATATVEAIEASTREVTLKKADGTYAVVQVSREVKQFDKLKIGDKITAKYYDNIVLRLKPAGEPDVDTTSAATTRAAAGKAGTAAAQRTITATITAIDNSVPSITFTGPNKWSYSSRVEDTKALAKVKVGDRVDITWTAAMLLSFEASK